MTEGGKPLAPGKFNVASCWNSQSSIVPELEVLHRQQVTRLVYATWTSGGGNLSALASCLIDGRVDVLGDYVTFADYDDELEMSNIEKRCIDRIQSDDLPYDEFVRRFMIPNEPVVILGLTKTWRAQEEWVQENEQCGKTVPNLDFVAELFGDDVVQVHEQPRPGFGSTRPTKVECSLAEYAEWWKLHHLEPEQETEHRPLRYLKDWKFVALHSTYGAYDWPLYFQDDWLNDENTMGNAYKFVYVGPKGTVTGLHTDVLQSFSWSTNVCGRKRWYLVPPQYSYLLCDCFGGNYAATTLARHMHADWTGFFPGLQRARRYAIEILQEAGETIFVPSKWFHTVENLEPTLSINHNWLNRANIRYSWEKLEREIRAYLIQEEARKGHNVMPLEKPENRMPIAQPTKGDGNNHENLGDDLLTLGLILCKKAMAIIQFCDRERGFAKNQDEGLANRRRMDLAAIVPVLKDINLQLIQCGTELGLTLMKQLPCSIDELICSIERTVKKGT